MKDLTESPAMSVFRAKFEAGRSFDLDDDMEYCPGLLDDDDVCDDLSLGSGYPGPSLGVSATLVLTLDRCKPLHPHHPTALSPAAPLNHRLYLSRCSPPSK